MTNLQLDTTNESQEVSTFPAGGHKAHLNRRAQRHSKRKTEKHQRSTSHFVGTDISKHQNICHRDIVYYLGYWCYHLRQCNGAYISIKVLTKINEGHKIVEVFWQLIYSEPFEVYLPFKITQNDLFNSWPGPNQNSRLFKRIVIYVPVNRISLKINSL